MTDFSFLTNQFLIAMPNLVDPNFFHAVTYICHHNTHGAMGIVINQRVNFTLGELMQKTGVPYKSTIAMTQPVFHGGPVDTANGFVLHRPIGHWKSTLNINDDMGVSTSDDIIRALSQDHGPAQYLVALGYAGWGSGQLEAEIAQNIWLSGPVDPRIIFETPIEQRWESAARLLGIDINQLTAEAGHA